MKIIEFQHEDFVVSHLKNHEWGAARFLYKLIVEDMLYEVLGKDTKIIILVDHNKVVSFATYSNQDCVRDDNLFPWIGFVYTEEQYRGNRYSQLVIEYIIKLAKNDGYKSVYLATDHKGLYEKYGFKYLEDRIDIYNEISRVYKYELID